MSKNNSPNFLSIGDYKNDQKEEYMNIAAQNEENFKNKKFEKFKSRNSVVATCNLLKNEENKLKSMLFSILKHEEKKSDKPGKLSNTIIISHLKAENRKRKSLNRNYLQFKMNSKNLKNKTNHKIKKSKSEIELLDNIKKINSNISIIPQHEIQNAFSFKNHKMQKELQIWGSSISNKKESRNNLSSYNRNEKDYNSDDNQASSKCLKLSSRNGIPKMPDKLQIFFNKKEEKNCLDINKEKLKNTCTFYNSNNNEETNKKYTTSISIKNIKNSAIENYNILSRNKKANSVSIKPNDFSNLKHSLLKFSKSDKNNNKLKINKHKIFKNKEKTKKNLIIDPESKHWESSCISSHKNRPKIFDSSISSPQRFSSTKESIKNIRKILSKIYKHKELEKKETDINKSTKNLLIIKEKFRRLTHKGLVYDSLDDEASEFENMASNNYYIEPNSKFNIIFDLIIFSLTVYTSITIPYFLAKNIRECKGVYFSFFHLFNCLSEIFNVIDTILGFFKAYYNYEEQLIKKSKLMIINYIKSWFLIDLTASIPFYSIFNSYEPECRTDDKIIFNKYYNTGMHKLHYLFICIKMIKLFKIFKNNRGYKQICKLLNHRLFFQDKGALIAKTYTILLIIHFGACIHIFIGRNSYPNWILNIKMETKGFLEIYLTAVYCLIMTITSVGYGDITCYSFNERIFQIILLIFGIMAYSWIVSSISSSIEKHNNSLIDFKEKKDILKDIQLHHPNMPAKLYNKIMLFLKYRNHNEKQNKNLIFDCLPISLKNNLIYEMYKPIITKFNFFKNIDNEDFIVKVILAFRPVIAVKNDIIFNDGDIVEEIVFVKKGILTVQLLINFENYKENIKKYSTIILFNLENKSNLENTLNLSDNNLNNNNNNNNNAIIEQLANHAKKNSLNNNLLYNNSLNNNSLNNCSLNNNSLIDNSFSQKIVKKTSGENKNRRYIKIINIRENEHFGDVLMFSEHRSPMRVIVRSKKAELFILKKEDVVKISFTYNNIWRRINEKSVYNFEQMKKSIQKIIEVLSPQALKKTIFHHKDESGNNESLINEKSEYKKDEIENNEENNNDNSFKQKNNEKRDSKNINEKKNFNSNISSSNFTENLKKSEVEKENEKENKNKDIEMKENLKEHNKTESTLILMQYSSINNDSKNFNSEYIKSKKKLKTFKKVKNKNQNNSFCKKRDYSAKCLINKKNNRFHLNNNSTINNNTHIINDQRNMTTPYKKEEINQEIYTNEKFDLTNVDENCDNLFSKKILFDSFLKNKNENNDSNTKSEIITNYKNEKLNRSNDHNNYNIISKVNNFSIKSSYENFNILSNNILIFNKILQKNMKIFLKKQLFRQKRSQTVIKTNKLNLDLSINEGNLNNNSHRKTKLFNSQKDSTSTLNNISFDSRIHNNNIVSVNGIPVSKFKKDINESSNEGSIKKTPSKARSNLSLSRVHISRNLSVAPHLHPLNRSRRSSENKTKKNFKKNSTKSNKNNYNLLSLINGNIMNSTENLIEPDKFYRRYFATILNKNNNNNQSFTKRKKYRRLKTRNDFANFPKEYKCLSPKARVKRNKSYSTKKTFG